MGIVRKLIDAHQTVPVSGWIGVATDRLPPNLPGVAQGQQAPRESKRS